MKLLKLVSTFFCLLLFQIAGAQESRSHQRPEAEGKANLERLLAATPDKASWEERKAILRSDIAGKIGIDKVLEPFDGKVYLGEKRVYKDYYVQNIGLEILPGLYATGAVYHPVKYKKKSCPIVINPHGHYPEGHYAEPVQVRCAMQARMGCISISFDMFDWGEQPMFDKSHHRTKYAQPVQVLSVIRLLDWALSLPEADSSRVAVTGSSGGASQAIFAAAIDDRFTLSIPVVMISSHFDGGCPCESGTDIHLSGNGTNNVELAALFAPKPMLVVSDGEDWTKNTPEVEFPYLKAIYSYYNAEAQLENLHLSDEGHDYGPTKRQAAYSFLDKHWKLKTRKLKTPQGLYDESGCVVEDFDLLKVWGPDGSKRPSDAINNVKEIDKLLGWE